MRSLVIRICVTGFAVALLAMVSHGAVWAQAERFVVVEAGFEFTETLLSDELTAATVRSRPERSGFSTDVAPVFSVVGRTFLFDAACPFGYQEGATRLGQAEECLFGLGFRFAGAQRRLAGQWFSLDADPTATIQFEYNSTRISGELLLGALTSLIPVIAVGYQVGNTNYDLEVFTDDQLLINQTNQNAFFQATTVYVNFAPIMFNLLDIRAGGFVPTIEFSVQQTLPGENAITVPDLNGGADRKVDFRTRTNRLTLQWFF